MPECSHIRPNYLKDVVIVILFALGIFVLIEGLRWVFNTNQLYARVLELHATTQQLHERLQRNGLN